jgi:D-3-phosphoglycerate dehydrogenase / 2-oxoglutarate reductase
MDSVLVTEEIADAGVDLLRRRFEVDVELGLPADELASRIASYDGLIVRSATRVTAALIDRGRRLRVIGRAGTGVDNVDIAAATRRGIIVANAPGSNMVAAAEHAIGLLVALARNIPQAHAALVQGKWERSRFAGVELADKTLAVIGFGRIGQLVAARARALGMRVVVYDPFVSAERCRELQVTSGSLENVLLQADFVTLHAPLTDDTRNLINADRLHLMKRGARIVNAARGDLVDLDALVEALESGQVAGAALDVFPEEPYTSGRLLELPNVVVTPHLGASTHEAQDRAGVIVAEQVAAALTGGFVSNAVNIPHVRAEDMDVLGPYIPLANRLGELVAGLSGGGFERVDVTCAGALAEHDTRLVTQAVLAGVFGALSDEPVNLVNSRAVAEARGIDVGDESTRTPGDYTNLVRVTCGETSVAGTTIGREQRPWLVEVDGYRVEIELAPAHLLVMMNEDTPGMIGQVGMLFGEEGVNISNMSVSRSGRGSRAVMVLAVDADPSPEALERLRGLGGIHRVRLVTVNGRT